MKIQPVNVFLLATNLCTLTRRTSIYLEQESLGLGASLFGPVKLPFTLPAVTDSRFQHIGSKVQRVKDTFPAHAGV